ncbi:MAG: TRAP-type C4-dicarboxylate transport system, large permease component [Moraxellaceae bacterium]|nr:TRAP-type C4-dicarboxylate transport system, large permease component [Moraxellaceae bacterium]
MIFLLIAIIIIAALAGTPIFAVIAAAAMLGFYSGETPLTVIAVEMYRLVDTPLLLALPMFTLAGYLLGESRTSERLVRLARAGLGWMPGGLPVVAFLTCAFLTAFTGASGVTIVALGAMLYPALKMAGYPDRFSLGLVTSSGALGLLLPPSLPLILYAVIAQQLPSGAGVTIQDVFTAGLLPCLVMIIALSLFGLRVTKQHNIPLQKFTWGELRAAAAEAKWELPLPVFVFAGIYGGFFAVSEAAAVTALYVLITQVLIYREIRPAALPRIMREAMMMVGSVLLIVGVAMSFTNWLIDAEVPTRLFDLVREHIQSKYVFLLALTVFLLLLGMMLDIFSALVIMVPLILPMAVGYGVHPVHLGIIFLATMEIGYCLPPVGMNLVIGSFRFRKPLMTLAYAALPFTAVLLLAALIITYVPWLSLVFIQ